jgi:HSP20 family molecular chaperone IbpA
MSNFDYIFVDKWFDQFFDGIGNRKLSDSYPYNLYYNKGSLYLELACAGFSKDEIKVKVTGKTKFLVSMNADNIEDPDITYHHRGISKRNFERTFSVTSEFDLKGMIVSYTNGLLRIKVPEIEKEEFEVEIVDIESVDEEDMKLIGD